MKRKPKIIDLWYVVKKEKYKYISEREKGVLIREVLSNRAPFFMGRLGGSESAMLRIYEFGYKNKQEKVLRQLCEWSGFFPEDLNLIERFYNIYVDSMREIDVMCPFPFKGINYFINQYMPHDLQFTESILGLKYSEDIWTKYLAGKKVLVVHPFQETINSQYTKREKLFANPNILPEFELITYKAVQTIGRTKDQRFATWFDALDHMTEEIREIDFDVALIGCGAYGFPLAARVKKMGKTAIHVGGELQLLFGIKGERWDKEQEISGKYYNDAWVYPDVSERPQNYKTVEGGCYW